MDYVKPAGVRLALEVLTVIVLVALCGLAGRDPVEACTMASPVRKFDAVIVGAGGAGMRASLQLAEAGHVGRGAVQGVPDALAHGRGAGRHRRALGNMGEDNWLWHMYDTVKGSD